MKHKKVLFILAGCICVSIIGTVSYVLTHKKEIPVVPEEIETEASATVSNNYDSIGELLWGFNNLWLQPDTENGGEWLYSVTDLDGNTLPEIIATRVVDEQFTSDLHIYAVVDEAYSKMEECNLSGFDSGDIPDLSISATEYYEDTISHDNRFIFDDAALSDDGKTITNHRYAVYLKNCTLIGLHTSTIASNYSAETGQWTTQYYTPDGQEVTLDEYRTLELQALPGYHGGNHSFQWITQGTLCGTPPDAIEALNESYGVFKSGYISNDVSGNDVSGNDVSGNDTSSTD